MQVQVLVDEEPSAWRSLMRWKNAGIVQARMAQTRQTGCPAASGEPLLNAQLILVIGKATPERPSTKIQMFFLGEDGKLAPTNRHFKNRANQYDRWRLYSVDNELSEDTFKTFKDEVKNDTKLEVMHCTTQVDVAKAQCYVASRKVDHFTWN